MWYKYIGPTYVNTRSVFAYLAYICICLFACVCVLVHECAFQVHAKVFIKFLVHLLTTTFKERQVT